MKFLVFLAGNKGEGSQIFVCLFVFNLPGV